jgi:hypothetical protein
MQIVQELENPVIDPRWIELRVSRINIVLNSIGVLVAIGMLALVPMAQWLRIAMGLVFLAAFLWDLRLILLKSRQSVGAFYLFDLDQPKLSVGSGESAVKLGIRLRYSIAGLIGLREAEGTLLSGAFVSPWFTAIRYALPQDPRWRKWWPHIIPVWSDSIETSDFRRVRVALKWK